MNKPPAPAPLEWLNYHHLLYFHTVAREGSVTRAAQILRLAQPTLSGQIRKLEDSLDQRLFLRRGRGLELTAAGQVVYRYADEIFGIGRELLDAVRGRATRRPVRLLVGISDVVPKLVAYRLLAPALEQDQPVHLVLREGKTEDLLAGLAVQSFDLVIADVPLASHVRVRAFNHPLGECGVAFLAVPRLARLHGRDFPRSLDAAPLLLPTDNTALRRSLEQWFDQIGVRPRLVAEIEDSALTKVFGQNGAGIFAVPEVTAEEICRQYRVRRVGTTDQVRESLYAITVERRIKNPVVAAITAAARQRLFG
jgi:LysR family transcriptional activator of nhaA